MTLFFFSGCHVYKVKKLICQSKGVNLLQTEYNIDLLFRQRIGQGGKRQRTAKRRSIFVLNSGVRVFTNKRLANGEALC